MRTKTERLNIRLPAKLKDNIKTYCLENDMDISYYVITLIRTHLKKQGKLTVKPTPTYWTGSVDDMPL